MECITDSERNVYLSNTSSKSGWVGRFQSSEETSLGEVISFHDVVFFAVRAARPWITGGPFLFERCQYVRSIACNLFVEHVNCLIQDVAT